LHFFFFFLFSSVAAASVERSILMAPEAPARDEGMKSSSSPVVKAFLPVSLKSASMPSPVVAHVSKYGYPPLDLHQVSAYSRVTVRSAFLSVLLPHTMKGKVSAF